LCGKQKRAICQMISAKSARSRAWEEADQGVVDKAARSLQKT